MASEPIKVCIRFRPLSTQECEQGEDTIWSLNKTTVSLLTEDLSLYISDKKVPSTYKPSFKFDHCFSWDSNNEEIYSKVAKNLVLSALDGYNATIFAYGQTGSGKTYTMLGKTEDTNILSVKNLNIDHPEKLATKNTDCSKSSVEESSGLIIFALEDIFSAAKSCPERRFYFSCSYMEIYNEHVYDLLKSPEEFTSESLSVIEGPGKEFIVRGLSEQVVTSIEEVLERLYKGEQNRHYAATNLNHHSSRSHTIFKLNVKSLRVVPKSSNFDEDDSYENITTESAINFVDLAGSEKVNSVQAAAEIERMKPTQFSVLSHKSDIDRIVSEGKNINTSLFYLCQVINKLSEKKLGLIKTDSHIPFRNSNLTKILRSSLAGNARTCIICTVTAVKSQFEQTLSTLRFGNSARSITNKVRANIRTETNTQLLLTYEQDIANLKREVELTYQRGKAYSSETLSIRQQLETRILNLSKKIIKKNSVNIIRCPLVREFKDVWTARTGDMFSSVEAGQKILTWDLEKFSEKGSAVFRELQVVDRERKNLMANVVNLNGSIGCLMAANQNLAKEKERFELTIEKVKEEKARIDEEANEIRRKRGELEERVRLFEVGDCVEDMDDREAETFEYVLINRIKQVKEEVIRRRYQQQFDEVCAKANVLLRSERF